MSIYLKHKGIFPGKDALFGLFRRLTRLRPICFSSLARAPRFATTLSFQIALILSKPKEPDTIYDLCFNCRRSDRLPTRQWVNGLRSRMAHRRKITPRSGAVPTRGTREEIIRWSTVVHTGHPPL